MTLTKYDEVMEKIKVTPEMRARILDSLYQEGLREQCFAALPRLPRAWQYCWQVPLRFRV